jgi:hypothetical protein
MNMMYKYRKDDGTIIEVPWEVMIEQKDGFITLEDGSLAQRCLHLEEHGRAQSQGREHAPVCPHIVSDSLGFGQHQLADFRTDAERNGFAVEFKPDPRVPEFYQVHCESRAEMDRYIKHRGMVNASGIGGVRLTEDELRQAEERVKEKYPCAA